MDEEVKTASVAETPSMPETQDIAEAQEAVSSEEATTQPTSGVAVEKETSGAGQTDTSVSEWENEKKSMAGRLSQRDKELNEYREKLRYLEALDRAAANDPEFMKLANKKLVEQGLLDESILEQLDIPAPQQKSGSAEVDPAVRWAQAKMREEQTAREKFFIDFEDRHPDLKDGAPEVVRANRSAIGAAAAKRMAEGASQQDAYEFAYKLIMNPNQLVEEGKLQGMAQAQSASPVEGAASGGSASSSGGVELTPDEIKAAKLFGVKVEAYAENKED